MPVYLELFHGRKSVREQLQDWGSPGPILGPLAIVHTTYAADIKLQTSEGSDGVLYLIGDEQPDLLYYNGTLHGDWSVFGSELLNQSLALRVEQFDQQKALAGSGPKVHA